MVYFGSQAGTWRGSWSVSSSVGELCLLTVRCPLCFRFSDVKTMIRGFLCHVREHVVKPILEQNADTGVFSLGDFQWVSHKE
jgi:hypothetical protein